jgi:two-component system, OmpR family, heavy metal sensor histidine kinase CusS
MSSATTRKPWSLAARLTLGFGLAAFLLILVATGALDWALRWQFNREQDEILADKARVLAALVQERSTDDRALRQEIEWEWSVTRRSRTAMRIVDAAGHPLLETPGMSDHLPSDLFAGADDGRKIVRGSDGVSYRIVRQPAANAAGEPRVLHLALDRSEDDELLREFRTVLALVLGIAPLACAAIGYGVARRGLRPLADVSATAARINAANLGQRMASTRMPAELANLAETINGMLGRLEDAFGRITRFSADIAHELRTPLQVLRGEAEVALTQSRSPEEYRQVLGSGLEEYARLAKLIDSLLFLARTDHPETQISREPLDLAKKLAATAAFYEPMAAEGAVTIATECEAGLRASLDRTLVQRALGNLVANALAHTPPGGRVTLRAARRDDGVQIDVEDTGCGIAPEHLPYIFDRFYRADAARTSGAGHVGLGLTLVKSIAMLHGGTAEVESKIGRGTRVRLNLPG